MKCKLIIEFDFEELNKSEIMTEIAKTQYSAETIEAITNFKYELENDNATK